MPPAGEQVIWGKAFEYACLMAIYNALKDNQEVIIEDTPQVRTAERFFKEDFIDTVNLSAAANGAVKMLMRLEPQLVYPADNNPCIYHYNQIARVRREMLEMYCVLESKMNGK